MRFGLVDLLTLSLIFVSFIFVAVYAFIWIRKNEKKSK